MGTDSNRLDSKSLGHFSLPLLLYCYWQKLFTIHSVGNSPFPVLRFSKLVGTGQGWSNGDLALITITWAWLLTKEYRGILIYREFNKKVWRYPSMLSPPGKKWSKWDSTMDPFILPRQLLLLSLVPRLPPDFIPQPWKKISTNFSPQLWDKIWEWPGNKGNSC